MAQYEFIRVDIEDGSKSDFIANFGDKLANSFIKVMKNPNMPNACKNIDRWNKFYRLAKEGKLSNDDFYKFAKDECKIDFYRNYYDDELPNENAIINLCSEVVKAYQSEEDSIANQIEEVCQMSEADEVRDLGEDNGWKCYEILSPEASVKYGLKVGGKAKWCISGGYFDGKKDVLEEAEYYFNDYKNTFDTYYFIIGNGTKFAICPKRGEEEARIWNQQDDEVDADAIPNPPFGIKELRDYLFSVNYDKVCDIASRFAEAWENKHIPVLAEKLHNYLSNMLPQDYTDEQVDLYFDEVKTRLKRYHITVYNDIEEYYVSDDFKEVTPKEEYDKIINEPLSKEDLMGFTPKEIFEESHFREMPYRKQDLLGKKTYDIIMDYLRKDGYNIIREIFDRLYEGNAYFKFLKVQGYEDSLKKIQDYAKQNPLSFDETENPHFAHASVMNQNTEDMLGGGYTSDFKSYLEHTKYLFLQCRSSANSTTLFMYDDNESLAMMLGAERYEDDWVRILKLTNQRADHDNVEMFKQVRKDVEDILSKLK